MPALKIDNVFKSFGDTHLLKGINLEVEPGDFLILVGPSGCGKSTLLNIIAGLENATSGEVHIGEREVTHLTPKQRDIAMVFQSYALYPNMTVRKNISFGLEIRKVPAKERRETVDRVARMLRIEELLDRKPSQLSGGQRQRVAMGRALARNPTLFLFDEPLSNLDAKLRVEMRTEIKELHQRINATIVYVTHDQIEAMTLGDQIAVMKDGIIQQFGSPLEIYNIPENMFVAGFMGSPSMNFIPATVAREEGRVGVWMKGEAARFFLPLNHMQQALGPWLDKEVVIGIRPEQMTDLVTGEVDAPGGQCRIDMFETTGPDTLVFTRLNNTKVVCRVHPAATCGIGEAMPIGFDTSLVVAFDPKSQTRIS